MSQHYYSENPLSEIREKSFSYTIKGETLKLISVSGVFAFGSRVDRASELLIESFRPSGGTVLDMGCGYGAIGLFIRKLHPGLKVVLSDVNSRAVEYAGRNALDNGLEIEAVQGGLFSALSGRKFDDIVSNPPMAAGKALNTQFITESLSHLNSGGALWLTAFHNKGGRALKGIMEAVFGNVEDIEKSGGIRVYRAVKY